MALVALGVVWPTSGPAAMAGIYLLAAAACHAPSRDGTPASRHVWRHLGIGLALHAVAVGTLQLAPVLGIAVVATVIDPMLVVSVAWTLAAFLPAAVLRRGGRELFVHGLVGVVVASSVLVGIVLPMTRVGQMPLRHAAIVLLVMLLDSLLFSAVTLLSSSLLRSQGRALLVLFAGLTLATDTGHYIWPNLTPGPIQARWTWLGWVVAALAVVLAATRADAGRLLGRIDDDWVRQDSAATMYGFVPAVLVPAAVALVSRTATGRIVGVVATAAVGLLVLARLTLLLREVRDLGTRQERLRWQTMHSHAHDVVMLVDVDGTVTDASPSLVRRWGLQSWDAIGRDVIDFIEPSARTAARAYLEQAPHAAPGTSLPSTRLRAVDTSGRERMAEVVAVNLLDDPSVASIVLVARDVTAQQRMQRELARRALTDPLTGLANRRVLRERLGELLAVGVSPDAPGGVLFVDLDDFKEINDALGHDVGDQFLCAVAARLDEVAPAGAIVARLGGDEFAVLQERATADELSETAHALGPAVSEPLEVEGTSVRARISVGLAQLHDGQDVSTALRHADLAMYEAKRLGKAQVAEYREGLQDAVRRRLDLRRDLAIAIQQGELVLHGQPIVDAATGAIRKVEMLVRWRRGDELVSPGEFVPLAEETGLIHDLGAWTLREALEQWREWPRAASDVRVAVNVSGVQLRTPGYADLVERTLADAGVSPRALTIELTETAFLQDVEVAVRDLQRLRALGVHVAMDDFGQGWSSLHALLSLPLDVIKIDRAFTSRLTGDERLVADQVVRLATSLDALTVAEGVETAGELRALQRHGVDALQGWLFERDLPREDLRALLAEPWYDLAAHGGRRGQGVVGPAEVREAS